MGAPSGASSALPCGARGRLPSATPAIGSLLLGAACSRSRTIRSISVPEEEGAEASSADAPGAIAPRPQGVPSASVESEENPSAGRRNPSASGDLGEIPYPRGGPLCAVSGVERLPVRPGGRRKRPRTLAPQGVWKSSTSIPWVERHHSLSLSGCLGESLSQSPRNRRSLPFSSRKTGRSGAPPRFKRMRHRRRST